MIGDGGGAEQAERGWEMEEDRLRFGLFKAEAKRLDACDLCLSVHRLLEAVTNYVQCVTALKSDPSLLALILFFFGYLGEN